MEVELFILLKHSCALMCYLIHLCNLSLLTVLYFFFIADGNAAKTAGGSQLY